MASGERVAAFAQFVQSALEPPLLGLVVSVFHINPLTDDDLGLREWFGNLDPIPARQTPAAVKRDRERQNRRAGLLRQQQRAGLRFVNRPARAVHGEGCALARSDRADHLNQPGERAARRAVLRRVVAEPLNETRDVFRIEAARRHHDDAAMSPEICGDRNAVVPEAVYQRLAVGVMLPTLDFKFQSRADGADDPVERHPGEPNDQSLFKCVAVEFGERVEFVRWLFVRRSVSYFFALTSLRN